MAKQFRDRTPIGRRLRDVTPMTQKSISQEQFQAMFADRGVEIETLPVGGDPNPVNLLTLFKTISERLRSTGGRPALQDTEQRKIPVRSDDMTQLEQIADFFRNQLGLRVTAAQLASAMLTLTLRAFLNSTNNLQDRGSPELQRLVQSVQTSS